jgi:autotransporter-associated beta strand protein
MIHAIRLWARCGMAALGAAALATASSFVQAQSTWDGGGGDNNWTTAANWNGDQAPTFPTGLVFAGAQRPAPVNNTSAGTLVSGLTFDNTAAAFNVTGAAITLLPSRILDSTTNAIGANNGGATNSSASAQTVALALSLANGRHTFTTDAGSGSLTLSGAITPQLAGTAHFIVNGGNIVTSLNNNTTGIIGGWASTGTDPNTASWAARGGSGEIVPYTAFSHTFSNLEGFPLTGVTANSNIKFVGGGDVVVPSATSVNTILLGEQTNLAYALNVTDTLTFSNGGGIFRAGDVASQTGATTAQRFTGGAITAGTAGAATLYIRTRTSEALTPNGNGPPEALFIDSQITNNAGGGAVSVVKYGHGVLRLNNALNSFTGGLYVNEGQLRPTGPAAGALSNSMGASTSPVYVAQGAQVLLGSASEFPNPMFLAGIGPVENGNQGTEFRGGALRFNSPGGIVSGTVTLLAEAGIGARGGQATTGPGGTVSGKITGAFPLRLNRQMNQGGQGLTANMPTLTLSNPGNDWSGGTSMGNGRVRIGASEVIPDGPGVGNLEMVGETTAAPGYTILNLNGNTETVNGLNSSGTAANVFITNTTDGTTGTIRFGNTNAASTFQGAIADTTTSALGTGTLSVVKLGTGSATLDSILNAWSGDTKIFGGTLSFPSGAPILGTNSTLQITNNGVLNLASGSMTVAAYYVNGVAQPANVYTSANSNGRITGAGSVTVTALGPALRPGDFNGDGVVNGLDLAQWRHDAGVNGGSDADYDGDSDGNDFLIWQRNVVAGPLVAAAGQAPEPGGIVLVACAAVALGAARRKRC